VPHRRAGRKIATELAYGAGHQINEQSFGQHGNVGRLAAKAREQPAPRVDVGQIETHALERAPGARIAQNLFLVAENLRQIDLHPPQRRREIHSVGTRIESRGKIQDEIGAGGDELRDVPIEEIRARGPGPRVLLPDRQRIGDLLSTLAGQRPGVRIAEHRVGPLAFARAIDGDPARGIGDVADQRPGHQAIT
jgi:hypothetical protein